MARKKPLPEQGTYARAAVDLGDGLARICRLYGMSPLIGRLYATLFLAREAMTLEELAGAAGVAKSSASAALGKLRGAGAVLRRPPSGDRRDYYEAVADPFQLLDHWRRQYFAPEAEMWRATGAALEDALHHAKGAPPAAEAEVVAARIARMGEFMDVFDAVMSTFDGAPAAKRARSIAVRLDDEDAK